MSVRELTPPPDVALAHTEIEYTKKARHGHGQDVLDENNVRQVAGCLPIDTVNRRFMLISSSKVKGKWVLPKGGWESNESQAHAALRETWEEAGLKGRITRQLGVFAEKTKYGVKAHHWIFEMEIKEVAKKFPEKKKRERRWFTYEEALVVVRAPFLLEAIRMSSLNPENTVPQQQQSSAQGASQSQQYLSPYPQQQQPSPSPDQKWGTTPEPIVLQRSYPPSPQGSLSDQGNKQPSPSPQSQSSRDDASSTSKRRSFLKSIFSRN
ncbi:NUDIX hydrolase domain-like protein [Radiomyces spectabilis]|uniref:NUDIX hydrolase domain-like protein n=1 Tax=Radiomyces spectabilis TaxID=64574 RepID=UPI00221F9B6B|nr:NUDIX hydrolase domain-like protein [Radiomyces spectabilis]KAI8369428.1 NUDIX hydrolase domain-like protein [Radiomyces spectabilis]